MKGKNKKTKVIKKKIAVKAVKSKGVAKKPAPNANAVKRPKVENILGSMEKPEIETLGTKILVQEIKDEPKVATLEIPVVEERLIPQANIMNPQIVAEDEVIEESEPVLEDDQIQPQAGVEQEYKQKELSPRQKNIIMYVSLTAIMSVLVVFWGFSIKNSMSQVIVDQGSGDDSQSLINAFQGTFEDLKTGVGEITNQNQNADIKSQALQDVKEQIITDKVKNNIANQLKEKLENLNANNNANANANTTNLNTSN